MQWTQWAQWALPNARFKFPTGNNWWRIILFILAMMITRKQMSEGLWRIALISALHIFITAFHPMSWVRTSYHNAENCPPNTNYPKPTTWLVFFLVSESWNTDYMSEKPRKSRGRGRGVGLGLWRGWYIFTRGMLHVTPPSMLTPSIGVSLKFSPISNNFSIKITPFRPLRTDLIGFNQYLTLSATKLLNLMQCTHFLIFLTSKVHNFRRALRASLHFHILFLDPHSPM